MRVIVPLLLLISSLDKFSTTALVVPSTVKCGVGVASTGSGRHRVDLAASASDESSNPERRDILMGMLAGGSVFLPFTSAAWSDDDESFAEIAARASKISKDLGKEYVQAVISQRTTDKTSYDFSLPYEGQEKPFKDLIRQGVSEDGETKVKAILVVNIKQDDPVARKAIPELISLASKYGRDSGAFAVVACPSDQVRVSVFLCCGSRRYTSSTFLRGYFA
jgi:hypothetical protein